MNKQKLKKAFKFVGIKVLGAFIFVAVAGTSIWALAAFTEPTNTPSNSVQDWAKNIMGANNSDNAFDSSSVTANSDGSVVERLEKLENHVEGVTAISDEQNNNYHYAAAEVCGNLNGTAAYAIGDSNTSTTYTDWRLPTVIELEKFVGMDADSSQLWTTNLTTNSGNDFAFEARSMVGTASVYSYNSYTPHRCVR